MDDKVSNFRTSAAIRRNFEAAPNQLALPKLNPSLNPSRRSLFGDLRPVHFSRFEIDRRSVREQLNCV